MTLLLTGASGFLGRRVAELMLAKGEDVVAIGRSAHASPTSGRFVTADLTDAAELRRAVEAIGPVDSIIHLAAMVPKSRSQDEAATAFEANLMGTVRLLGAYDGVAETIVFASTAEVYGLPEAGGPIPEDADLRPLSWYAASKVGAETYCRTLERRTPMRLSILRFTVLYGAGDTIDRAIPNFVRSAVRDDPIRLFGGEELRDYLHVDDAARAVCLAWERRLSGTYNVGSGQGIAVRDAARAVLAMTGAASPIELLPREKRAADIVLDTSRFHEATGFVPTHVFPQGLEEQIAWTAAAGSGL
jgi:UDP-glucose 4-epimerase